MYFSSILNPIHFEYFSIFKEKFILLILFFNFFTVCITINIIDITMYLYIYNCYILLLVILNIIYYNIAITLINIS